MNQLIGNTTSVPAVPLLKSLVSTELYRESLTRLLCKNCNFTSCAYNVISVFCLFSFHLAPFFFSMNLVKKGHNPLAISIFHDCFYKKKYNLWFVQEFSFYLLNLLMKHLPCYLKFKLHFPCNQFYKPKSFGSP